MQKAANLTINSHNIVFSKTHPYLRELLENYCRKLIQYDRKKRGKSKRVMIVKKSVFATSTINKSEIRFHINHKEDLLKYLKNEGYSEDKFNVIITPHYSGKDVEYLIKDEREPFDYQVPIISYITEPGKTKTITLGTGDGKTFATLQAVAKIGKRIIIVILGRYVNKWIKDVENSFHLKKGDLLVCRGSKHFIGVMNLALADELKAKIIICTSNTMQRYLKDHELGGEANYPILPGELFQTLDVGLKLIDECHQFFHLNFKMDLYTHIDKAVFLSATLEASDSFLNRMYRVMYPLDTRMQGKIRDRYIDVSAVSYRIGGSHRVNCRRNGSYSHIAYENHLLSSTKLLTPYLEMIWQLTRDSFIEIKQEGQKMLIFAGTIDMCTKIKEHLANRCSGLVVNKYTAEDPEDNLYKSDIIVSTLGSAGTAVDIINLKICLMTISISSKQQNIQALGRLRKLVNYTGDNPEFIYIYSPDIAKQLAYHKAKFSVFNGLCRSHKNYDSKHRINFSFRRN